MRPFVLCVPRCAHGLPLSPPKNRSSKPQTSAHIRTTRQASSAFMATPPPFPLGAGTVQVRANNDPMRTPCLPPNDP